MRQTKTYSIRQSATYTVLRLHTAVLDRNNSRQLTASLLHELDFGTCLLVDLSELKYLDAAGLSSVFACTAAAKRHGGQVTLCAPTLSVRALLRLARIDDHARLCESVEEATALVAESPHGSEGRGEPAREPVAAAMVAGRR